MLEIAIVGYNYDQSCRALQEVVNNDVSSKPRQRFKDQVIMEDGTRYIIFASYNQVRGHCVDQMIIVDDSRWMIYEKQFELIDWIKYRMCHSCVPEEFQILEYEW